MLSILKSLLFGKTVSSNIDSKGVIFDKHFGDIKITIAIDITNNEQDFNGCYEELVGGIYLEDVEIVNIPVLNSKDLVNKWALKGIAHNTLKHIRVKRAAHLNSMLTTLDDNNNNEVNYTRRILIATAYPLLPSSPFKFIKESHLECFSQIKCKNGFVCDLNTLEESLLYKSKSRLKPTDNRTIQLSWRLSAIDSGGCALVNNKKELSFLNLFVSKDNYNFFSTFKTSSGSSTFHSQIVMDIISRGGRGVILDTFGAYENLSKIIGTSVQDIDKETSSINPFYGINDPNEFLPQCIEFVIELIQNKTHLTENGKFKIGASVQDAYEKHGKTLELNHIKNEILNRDPEVAFHLKQFTTGEYKNLFNGKPSVTFEEKLNIFNLSALSKSPGLKTIITVGLAILSHRSMALPPSNAQKIIFIPDTWDILCGDIDFPATLEMLAKSSITRNICFGVETNRLNDIHLSSSLIALYRTNSWYFSTDSDIERITSHERFTVNILTKDELHNLVKVNSNKKKEFDEIFIKNSIKSNIFKNYIDPYTNAALSTLPSDYAIYEKFKIEGLNTIKILDEIVKEKEKVI